MPKSVLINQNHQAILNYESTLFCSGLCWGDNMKMINETARPTASGNCGGKGLHFTGARDRLMLWRCHL